MWVLCGVISTLGALTFAELGTTYPVSGSMYVYLQKMYGPFVAFQYQWEYYLLHRPAANAIKSLLFALYVIQPFFPGCDPPDLAVKLIAVAFASKCSGVAREGGGGQGGTGAAGAVFWLALISFPFRLFLYFLHHNKLNFMAIYNKSYPLQMNKMCKKCGLHVSITIFRKNIPTFSDSFPHPGLWLEPNAFRSDSHSLLDPPLCKLFRCPSLLQTGQMALFSWNEP